MPKKRRRFAASQKAVIVLEALKEEKSIAQIAAENGMHPNQIHKWKKQALENFSQLFEDEHQSEKAKEAEHEKQLNNLYAEIGRLSAQLSWLKKNLACTSRAERVAMLEKDHPELSLKVQADLHPHVLKLSGLSKANSIILIPACRSCKLPNFTTVSFLDILQWLN